MENKEKVIQAIYSAIDEVNRLLPKRLRSDKSPDAVIIGKGGKLDSLGLVNLIVAIEEKIEEEFGVKISLTNEEAMSETNRPLRSIRALTDYISLLLEEKTDVYR